MMCARRSFDVERLDLIKLKAEGRDAVQGTAVYGI